MLNEILTEYVTKRGIAIQDILSRYIDENLVDIVRSGYYKTSDDLDLLLKCLTIHSDTKYYISCSAAHIKILRCFEGIDNTKVSEKVLEEILMSYQEGHLTLISLGKAIKDIVKLNEISEFDERLLIKMVSPIRHMSKVTDKEIKSLDKITDDGILSRNQLYVLSAHVRLILTSKYNGFSKDKQVEFLNQLINE